MHGIGTAWEKPVLEERRLLRSLRLLRRIRASALPATHRNNRIGFFHEGRRFFNALHAAIRKAERFILVEYFLIRDDRTGKALAAGLIDAAKRGVRVYLIYDYIGSLETPAFFFRNMASAGHRGHPLQRPFLQTRPSLVRQAPTPQIDGGGRQGGFLRRIQHRRRIFRPCGKVTALPRRRRQHSRRCG